MPVPKVTVVIPTFNQAHFLEDAVDSVLAQVYQDYEIVLVNDGSTDHTEEVARRYQDKIRYVYQENQGLASARNTGIRAAAGEYVALLDSDDIWAPTFLTSMMALAQRFLEATVYYCGIRYIDRDKHDLPQSGATRVMPSDALYKTILRSNFLIPSTIVMKRAPVLEANLFDVSFRRLQDRELWIRLLRSGHQFAGLNEQLVRYRVHENNLSTDPVGGQNAARALIEKHFGVDDGEPDRWSADKRRAYGGLYRYCLLTNIQRKDDWKSGAAHLRRAFQCDPTLAVDMDIFNDLALGSQPTGYRGSSQFLNLQENAANIKQLLDETFQVPLPADLQRLRREACSKAYLALGITAYRLDDRPACRKYLYRCLSHNLRLWRDPRVFGHLIRSLLSKALINRLKRNHR